jgi:hypothetical protein
VTAKPLGGQTLKTLRSRGLSFQSTQDEPCTARFELLVDKATARKLKIARKIGQATTALGATTQVVKIKLTKKASKALKSARKVKLTLQATAWDAAGNTRQLAPKTFTLKR